MIITWSLQYKMATNGEEREPLLGNKNEQESPPPDYSPYPNDTTDEGWNFFCCNMLYTWLSLPQLRLFGFRKEFSNLLSLLSENMENESVEFFHVYL